MQNHLLMKIGGSEAKQEYTHEDVQRYQASPGDVIIEGMEDVQVMHSERIEHNYMDGSINFQIGDGKYIHQANVIKEEIDENESVQKEDSIEIEVEGIDDIGNGDGDGEEDVVLFIEYKYCTICHIEQPLRCKHCKRCDHCVATYDHHCPWIGNCVGERNRLRFVMFLAFQLLQLILGFAICSQVLLWNDKDDSLLTDTNQLIILFLFLLTLGFMLFVIPLLGFQCYLIT